PAPPIQGVALNGETIDLAALQGRPVALAFYKSNCPACKEMVPKLAPIFDRYAQEAPTISIGVGHDTPETMTAFAEANGVHTPILLDSSRSLRGEYSLYRVPTIFFLDPEGKVVERYNGATERLPDAVDQTFRALLGRADFPDYDEQGYG
ncbi:MAG: hypothetical protein C4321_04520, partial [Chloroflexota bacterium]